MYFIATSQSSPITYVTGFAKTVLNGTFFKNHFFALTYRNCHQLHCVQV